MYHYFRVPKKVGNQRGRKYQRFASKVLGLTMPKKYVEGNPLVFHFFRVSKNFG